MQFVRSRPNEFLVVGRGGRLRSLGAGASAFLLPGSTHVRVPSAKQEACFVMTQESRDGVPLRFKGLAVYRIVDPAVAASAFDFNDGLGHEQIQAMLAHVALGELRDLVSHLSMQACVEERKTTLTHAVDEALRSALAETAESGATGSWGIAIDLVQVAQVYVIDDELRSKLEAELRNQVLERSERSNIEMQEALQRTRLTSARRLKEEELENAREANRVEREQVLLDEALARERAQQAADTLAQRERSQLQADEQVVIAQKASDRRLEQEDLESTRESSKVRREKQELAQALAMEDVERKAQLKRLVLDRQAENLDQELSVRQKHNELRALEVEADLLPEREKQALEQEILPLRQVPAIAQAFSGMYQGATLSLYGADHALAQTVAPLAELLGAQLHRVADPAK